MIKLKRFWIDLIRFREWNIYLKVDHFFWKVKDYDRLQLAYDKLRNSYIKLTQNGIDLQKLGIIDMIDDGATIEELKKYLMS